ncbi:GrpB family protein [Cohnella sp. JJ-181]|uniref:GrpB family protein n=1 Tax=Cohnella rhizoplanae TaxID=2974897 RepID=UPI0022FFB7FF|nr:GrpB family protein [Cohnella sp. JJ-181]CAI6075847.1 hypothetical protein COHCIP112018_02494 [Cohnella sp. JJ-181]
MSANKPILIENYNIKWPVLFEELAFILRNGLGNLIMDIEHVRSTSVPGLAAKPIIDLDIVVDSMTSLPEITARLRDLGYYAEGNLGVEGREAFGRMDERVPYNQENKPMAEHHLYVCDRKSEAYRNHIAFRNALRQDRHLADQYSLLKRELAVVHMDNRQAYTEGKTQFVNKVING